MKTTDFLDLERNKGIEMASGQYIMFSDNDDEHDKDLCLKLYEAIVSRRC